MPTSPAIDANGQPLFDIQLRALSEGRDGNGVAGQSDLKVTDGTGDNESDIASGTAYYDGSSGSIGSTTTKTHSDGDGSNDRWDLIAFDVSSDSVVLREGTAAADPVPPDLQSNEVLLALVYIESSQTDFGSGDIVNWRILGGTGIVASNGGTTVVDRVTEIDAKAGLTGSDDSGGVYGLKLTNDTVTVAGNSVPLGGSSAIDHADLSNIGANDHHQDPAAGTGLTDEGTNQFGIASSGVTTTELDLSIAPTWTGTHTFTDGSVALDLGDQAADPSANGEITRNGTDVKIHSGGSVKNVSNIGGGSTSPGGSDTQLQYNNGGSFGGISGFTYDGSNLSAIPGLDATFQLIDQAADPSANGEIQRNGTDVKVYTGGTVRNLSLNSVTVAGNSVPLGGSTAVDYIDLNDTGSSFPIPNSDLSNSSVTVAGNSVSLGGSTTVDYVDLNDTGSSFPIPNADISNSSVTVAGNSISLGGSSSIDHADLSSVTANQHHQDPTAGTGITDEGTNQFGISSGGVTTTELDLSITPTWTGTHVWDTGANANLQVDESGIYYSTSNAEALDIRNAGTGSVDLQTDGASVVDENRTLSTGNALTGGGDLSSDRTFDVTTSPSTDTPVGTTRTLTGGHAIQSVGDLSTDRTVAVDATDLSGDGLKDSGSSTALDIEPADFAGNALEDDGSDDLAVSSDSINTDELASGAVTDTEVSSSTSISRDKLQGKWTTVTKTSNYTAANYENVLADASSSALTVTLPAAATDLMVTVKATDATNTVTIATPNSETIDGDSNRAIDQDNVSLTITSDGSNYFIV